MLRVIMLNLQVDFKGVKREEGAREEAISGSAFNLL